MTYDLTNERFGDLVALHRVINTTGRATFWLCRCSCGNERVFPTRRLTHKDATHCGCKTAQNVSKSHLEDLSGQVFGEITAISYVRSVKGHAEWLCRCSCGKEFHTGANSLKRRATQTCDECNTPARKESRIKDITNQQFEQLTALYKTKQNSKGEWYWMCRCSCGKEYEVKGSHLRSGLIKRCRACAGLLKRVDKPVSGYPAEFSLYLRGKIRKRDQYVCQYCQQKFGKGGLDIHHIDHDRNNNSPLNLISLCNKCHYKMHTKEADSWIPYWQSYMEQKYDTK